MSRKSHFLAAMVVFSEFWALQTASFCLVLLSQAGLQQAGISIQPKILTFSSKMQGSRRCPKMDFTFGGGGFIDLPNKSNFIRIGGFGNGFSSKLTKQVNDTLTKASNYSLGQGGISLEYVIPISKIFDISFGSQFSTGTLSLELYQYGKGSGNYGTIFGELQSNGTSSNLSRVFKSRFYTVQPQLGIGILLRKFMYLKIDCGYQLGAQSTWRVDNNTEVTGFPKGIEAKGLVVNVGLNFGLFIRE